MILKNLKKLLNSKKKDKNIFDIVVFGSFIKGKYKPSDIDIVIIFLSGNLNDRLDKLQEIKFELKKLDNYKFDIKQMVLKDFFSASFMAKTGILLEGYSIFKDQKFIQTIGFKSYSLFWYSLSNLTHTQKVKFNYILAGRNSKGILKELNATRLTNATIKVPIENSLVFEEILKNNNINFSKKNIFEEE
jgi:predicted nucleotidyltransferase